MDNRIAKRIARQAAAGFTLVELLLVITILGILAAMVVPQFGGQSENARRSITQASLAEIGSALQQYEIETGRFPDTLDALTVATETRPAKFKKSQLIDSWGTPFQYKKLPNYEYEVRSAGPDAAMNTEDDLWYPPKD